MSNNSIATRPAIMPLDMERVIRLRHQILDHHVTLPPPVHTTATHYPRRSESESESDSSDDELDSDDESDSTLDAALRQRLNILAYGRLFQQYYRPARVGEFITKELFFYGRRRKFIRTVDYHYPHVTIEVQDYYGDPEGQYCAIMDWEKEYLVNDEFIELESWGILREASGRLAFYAQTLSSVTVTTVTRIWKAVHRRLYGTE
jgi:hypothetical protein